MMGFGGMGMTLPWLIGATAIAAIWIGVWRLLLAIGVATPDNEHDTAPKLAAHRPASTTWQQPDFGATHNRPDEPDPTRLPTFLPGESDHR